MFTKCGQKIKVIVNVILIISFSILATSCKTSPPISPNSGLVSGKIYLQVNFTYNAPSENVNKKVLLEDFANVSCIPCVTSDKIIESLTTQTYNPDKLIPIKFATNFPSPSDPFYLAQKAACDSRMSYYNILFAPTVIIDGTTRPSSTDSIAIKSAIENSLQTNAPASISITGDKINGAYNIVLNVKFYTNNTINFNDFVLQVALTEKEIEFSSPPGSNGETKFYYVMRKMLPSFNGFDLGSMDHTGTVTLNLEGDISADWNLDKINTVAFIQNKSTKEIIQAGSTY